MSFHDLLNALIITTIAITNRIKLRIEPIRASDVGLSGDVSGEYNNIDTTNNTIPTMRLVAFFMILILLHEFQAQQAE